MLEDDGESLLGHWQGSSFLITAIAARNVGGQVQAGL